MPHTDAARIGLLEIARREQGAVEVALYWDPHDAAATVVVWNWSSGACLRLEARADEAKYAFDHPYAFATAQGIARCDVLRAA